MGEIDSSVIRVERASLAFNFLFDSVVTKLTPCVRVSPLDIKRPHSALRGVINIVWETDTTGVIMKEVVGISLFTITLIRTAVYWTAVYCFPWWKMPFELVKVFLFSLLSPWLYKPKSRAWVWQCLYSHQHFWNKFDMNSKNNVIIAFVY